MALASSFGPAYDQRWWEERYTDDRAERLTYIAGSLFRNLQSQRQGFDSFARVYSNAPIMGLTPRIYRNRAPAAQHNRTSLNLIASVIDTYTSLITKDRPKVSFETAGGDWSLQRKAKLLEKFVDGVAYETNLNRIAPQIVRDSALFGQGVVKLSVNYEGKKPRIVIERIRPGEILVEDQDAYYENPQSLYQYKYVDRKALQEEYPDMAGELESASSSAFSDSSVYESEGGSNLADLLVIVEGWHLPRVPGPDGSGDGRHTVACGTVLLLDEEYTRADFPFATLYRKRPVVGYWGQGLAEELKPLQIDITRLLITLKRAQQLAVGHWLVEENSNVNTNAIDDVVASIIRYRITKPEFVTSNAAQMDVYNHLWALWAKGFEAVGISQLAASQQMPAGVQHSGKAMLVYADVQSQRFEVCYREYQDWYMQIARHIIALAREASDYDKTFEVKATGTRSMMKAVRWADANLQDEEFSLRLYPTNQLADDPAAKMSMIQDMINTGMITPDAGKRLLDMPDLEAFNSLQDAPHDLTMRTYESMVEDGEYQPPEPYLSPPQLQESIALMQLCYLRARLDDVPTDRLELISRWLSQAASILAPPPPPPGAGPNTSAPPGVGPTAPPGGPPGLGPQTQADIQHNMARQAARQMTG